MPKTVNLADIALRLGVSTVTVSKALAGKKGMSAALREKIKETASELGYKPVKRSTPVSGTGNIGILVAGRFLHTNNSFYWQLYQRLLSCLLNSKYFGILETIPVEDELSCTLPRLLRDKEIDGLIIIGQLNRGYRRFISAAIGAMPLVFLDSNEVDAEDSYIISDGYYGMYAVTRHLINMGHTDNCFVGAIDETSSILDRYYGYCRAMHEYKLPILPAIPDRDENGYTDEASIKLPESLPSAFVCNCDVTAYYLMGILKKRGIEVPRDISIAGFDDYMLPGSFFMPITTYAVDMDKMASACAARIIQKILNPGSDCDTRSVIVSGRLVIRDSVRNLDA
ncbi:MAG: LacI family DNA-binding transcriptional regulator [Spirochaetaceae bacterium]|jgi:DNA-binding LacI/PurR family transcriptional regulator|nr:LacI family DNA-binding transcriptional regulator [Spirochaetaceae bacterium]